ncbi:MAG: hypothetical protein AAFY60_09360 [Myxococcota bacterium]
MQTIFARATNRWGFDVDRANFSNACRNSHGSSIGAADGPDIDIRRASYVEEWKASSPSA